MTGIAARYEVKSAAALLLLLSTACVTADPGTSSSPYLVLTPCPLEGVNGPVLCGTKLVREDRRSSSSRQIPLKVVVLKALSDKPQPDPLFTFSGGPGQADTADAKSNAERFAAIRRTRDIVMIDQRGTGSSNPLGCSFGAPSDIVRTFVAGELPSEAVARCRRELERKADLRFYTTPIAADDADEVRASLGYQKINLYGGSYGSRAALVYLKRHPERVRTITMRAVFPLSLRNPLYSPRDSQASFNKLADDCAADPRCRAEYPNLREDLHAVLQELSSRPRMLRIEASGSGGEADIPLTRNTFAGLIRRMLYHPATQALVPKVIAHARKGDFAPALPIVKQTLGVNQVFSMGMFLSVSCAEDVARIREDEIFAATRDSFVGDAMVRSLVGACKQWPTGWLPKDFHKPFVADVPALILSGALDPMTPPSYGTEVQTSLLNSKHVVMDGIAHGPFPVCAIQLMTEFVDSGSSQSVPTECETVNRRPNFALGHGGALKPSRR